MILPHIVKLFDASDVPLSVRRTALETVDHFADYLDLSDYTSKIIHPLVCPNEDCFFFALCHVISLNPYDPDDIMVLAWKNLG